MRKFLIASVAVAAVALGGCRMAEDTNQSGSSAEAPAGDWPGFVNRFIEATFKANPGFAVAQGRHEYDGQIADLSQAGDRRRSRPAEEGDRRRPGVRRRQADRRAAVSSATIWSRSPRASCSGSTRPARTSCTTIRPPISGMLDPSVYITVPYAPKEQRLKAYIKFLAEHSARRRADARQHQDADGDQLRRLCQERRSAASSNIIRATAWRRGRASARPRTSRR